MDFTGKNHLTGGSLWSNQNWADPNRQNSFGSGYIGYNMAGASDKVITAASILQLLESSDDDSSDDDELIIIAAALNNRER